MFRFLGLFLFGILAVGLSWAARPQPSGAAYEAYLKAALYETQGNLLAAKAEIKKAIKMEPDSSHLNYKLAEFSFYLGELEEAKAAIEKALELDAQNTKTLILAGQIHWALGNPEQAEKHLQKAVKLSPDDIEPLVTLVLAVTPRDPEKAIGLYEDYLKRHPSSAEIHERLAQLYRAQGETEKSKEAWKKSLEFEPNGARAHLMLAQMAEVESDTGTAISHYLAVLENDPDNLPLLLRVGELQYRNNDMTEAFQAFSRAQKIAPESPSANFWLALLREHRGEWEEAAALLESVLENSVEPGVLLRLSYYYTQMGERQKAIDILERLTQEEPENTDFLNYLAIAYEQQGEFSEAAQTMEVLVDLDPTNADYRFYLGSLYDRAKKFKKAEEELREAIKLDPEFHLALNYLGYSFADRNENLEEAEALLKRALELAPEKPAYLDSLGWVYYRQGRFDEAVQFLKKAAEKEADPLIWEHLGDAYVEQEKPFEAILAYDESLRLKPDQKKLRKKNVGLLKKISDERRAKLFIKRSLEPIRSLVEVQSLAAITVGEGIKKATVNGQFSYVQGELFKIEIPGPLSGPVLLVVKKQGKPVEYGALHPAFQTAEVFVKAAVEKMVAFLSGDVFNGEISKAETSSGNLSVRLGETLLVFDAKTGELEKITWTDSGREETLELGADPVEPFRRIPSLWIWSRSDAKFSIGGERKKPLWKKKTQDMTPE